MDIGRRAYEHESAKEEAAQRPGVSIPCINVYVRECMRSIGIERLSKGTKRVEPSKNYHSMTKDELINELMLKDIEAAKAKRLCSERRKANKQSKTKKRLLLVSKCKVPPLPYRRHRKLCRLQYLARHQYLKD